MKQEREVIPVFKGLGKALGSRRVTNEDIAKMMGRKKEVIDRMMRGVGIQERPQVAEAETTSTLAAGALLESLAMAQEKPENLKAIVVGTNSADYLGVALATMLQNLVGASTIGSYRDVHAGCMGFLHALDIVYKDLSSKFGQGGPQAVLGAEVLSRFIDPNDAATFPLFGDAAGAIIVDNIPDNNGFARYIKFYFGGDGQYTESLYVRGGGSRFPPSAETVEKGWHAMYMDGPTVEKYAVSQMAESVKRVMEMVRITNDDVLLLIPHQANLGIIKKMAQMLNFPFERVYTNIEKMGNTSTASIPVALTDAHDEGKLPSNELIVICGFGAGFNFGAAVIPTVGLPPKEI